MKVFIAGMLGALCTECITLGFLTLPEPNRLTKRLLGIPSELSGPHQYAIEPHEDALISGSMDFAYCALSRVDRTKGGCLLSRRRDGWHVNATEVDLGGTCAVTCLK